MALTSEKATPSQDPSTRLDFAACDIKEHGLENQSSADQPQEIGQPLERAPTHEIKWWKFHFRPYDDEGETDWWFASTAIPLLAATLGPLANVLSLAALVTYWRMHIVDADGNAIPELMGVTFEDPRWCYLLNVASLILGFVGNIFLLFNFTNRIRYIIALPMTIILWYIATGILIAITTCMNIYVPPERPGQTYTQGFWYAVIAAVLYLICSMLLMVNMLGYFLGHYPQRFDLTDHQRTLILQTMLFFFWLAGGGAIFARVSDGYGPDNNWGFVDGLYFCDVTILTVGFGDLYPHNDVGRGLVFPYSVGGIIMLGLMISSIHNFATELSGEKVVRRHYEKQRARTWERTVTSDPSESPHLLPDARPSISAPSDPVDLSYNTRISSSRRRSTVSSLPIQRSKRIKEKLPRLPKNSLIGPKKPKLLVLQSEKERFDAMRKIQRQTNKFKRWWALTLSVIAFGILWCAGAVVFWQAEKDTQGMTYFSALYFCYVSLLTIGYGDLSPRSNAGRAFFLVWSLIAVPTMTILISDMGETVIASFKRGTFAFADFFVLPKEGVWRKLLNANPWLFDWWVGKVEARAHKKRLKRGLGQPEDVYESPEPSISSLVAEAESNPSDAELARQLAIAIRRTAADLADHRDNPKTYCYEEWAQLGRLIRFTSEKREDTEREEDEEDQGLIEWDWIGEDSPMMAQMSEPEFVLDRLCESLGRYMRRRERMSSEPDGRKGSGNSRRSRSSTRSASNANGGVADAGEHGNGNTYAETTSNEIKVEKGHDYDTHG